MFVNQSSAKITPMPVQSIFISVLLFNWIKKSCTALRVLRKLRSLSCFLSSSLFLTAVYLSAFAALLHYITFSSKASNHCQFKARLLVASGFVCIAHMRKPPSILMLKFAHPQLYSHTARATFRCAAIRSLLSLIAYTVTCCAAGAFSLQAIN